MSLRTVLHSASILTLGLGAVALVPRAAAAEPATAAASGAPAEIHGDLLTFLDCQLPANEYVSTHYEKRDANDAPWRSGNGKAQIFRTMVNYPWRQVYWRKDDPDNDHSYYGEIFTFDDETFYLHTETCPPRTSVEPADGRWDARPDRFRVFVRSGSPSWAVGRPLAPIDASTTWRYQGHMNTYICNSFEEYVKQTAQLFQDKFYDNNVFLERYGPFSTVFDGDCEGWPASDEFKHFDEVIVINQCMANDVSRERFFIGRKGATHYGIVRWDNSLMRDGQWQVIERCVGLERGRTPDGRALSFEGMRERARRDPHLISDARPAGAGADVKP